MQEAFHMYWLLTTIYMSSIYMGNNSDLLKMRKNLKLIFGS